MIRGIGDVLLATATWRRPAGSPNERCLVERERDQDRQQHDVFLGPCTRNTSGPASRYRQHLTLPRSCRLVADPGDAV
jgi:hypothetical protein